MIKSRSKTDFNKFRAKLSEAQKIKTSRIRDGAPKKRKTRRKEEEEKKDNNQNEYVGEGGAMKVCI